MSPLVVPPSLRPGDRIAVVAPSSPVPESELWPGLAWVRGRYRLRTSARILTRQGFLAGSDADRARELSMALRDPEVRAIVAVRGGYGTMRIVDALDLGELVPTPKGIA